MNRNDMKWMLMLATTAILSFVATAMDFAIAILRIREGNYMRGIWFIILGVWCFYWGFRNFKNAFHYMKGF